MLAISVFVGSSSESRGVAEAVASILGSTFDCVCWWNSFAPSSFTLETLERLRRRHRFSVFVAQADDLLVRRGALEDVVRDNILGEFLMFVSGNGRDHTYLLLDRRRTPKLPSDLDGLVFATFDSDEFQTNPSRALHADCEQIARRISEVHATDVTAARELERLAMAKQGAVDLLALAETASLLRDVIDAVQRDTLEALLDEEKFAVIKNTALSRIEDIARPNECKAASTGVGREFEELKRSVVGAVAALPFPKDVFAGIDDARATYERSVLASFPFLAAAIERKDWQEAFRIATGLRGRISPETLLQEVATIADERLHRLKRSYTAWWRANSRTMRESLNAFQRALMRAQTHTAMQLAEDGMRAFHEGPDQ